MSDRNTPESAIRCYRCGGSLESLSLPLSRLDQCPGCSVDLHVCRMCRFYAPTKPDQCAEDDAIAVTNKTAANFCDYFAPSADAFGGAELRAETAARRQLDALFGNARDTGDADTGVARSGSTEAPADSEAESAIRAAEDLFRK